MTWQSLHVHYHEERLDDLVLDAVRPLFRRIAEWTDRAYFVPHWKRGPHLRLNVAVDPGTYARHVRPAAEQIIGRYLHDRPADTGLDPLVLLPLHERLANAENEDGPLLPWFPNNSIQPAPYDDRAAVLGSPEAAELWADFYVDTTDLTFRMFDHVRSGGSRVGLAFALMIATAQTRARGGITTGFLSFRSHAEAFLGNSAEGPRLRSHWDRHYELYGDRLRGQVRAVLETIDLRGWSGGPQESQVPFVLEWLTRTEPAAERGRDLLERDRIALRPASPEPDTTRMPGTTPGTTQGTTQGSTAPRSGAYPAEPSAAEGRTGSGTGAERGPDVYDPDGMGEFSDFHRLLVTTDWWRTNRTALWFLHYRLLLNLTYLHMTRLGVRPVERFMLGHLAANAVEDLYQISALEELRR